MSLRSLSILLRQQAAGSQDERMKNIEEGLAKAAEAVEMDPSDGLSWLVLGNSYLISFFSIAQSPRKMKQALAAYIQAVSPYIDLDNFKTCCLMYFCF